MSTSPTDLSQAHAQRVSMTGDALVVELVDGRTLMVPLDWYPRLLHGSATERARWHLIGKGVGIHWPDLDEDISVRACSPDVAPARRRHRYSDGLTHASLADQDAHCAALAGAVTVVR